MQTHTRRSIVGRLRSLLLTLALLLTPLLGLAATPTLAAGSGTVVAWGRNASGEVNVPAGLGGVIAVAGGDQYSLAVKSDGTVVAWGNNNNGQLNVPADLGPVKAIDAAAYTTVALLRDGTVRTWGRNAFGERSVPFGLSGVTAIAADGGFVLALKSDGTVVAWGDNSAGQRSVPAGLTGVTAIAAGVFHSLALKGDGTVVGWGYNAFGQASPPADLTGVTAIAAGWDHSLALKSDGTVVAWGNGLPASVPAGLSDVIAIAAGYSHSVALKSDGTVVAWGDNNDGQLNVPAGLTGVTGIGAGTNHTLAIIPLADSSAPTASPSQSPAATSAGWNNSDVTVSWNWTDGADGSGLDSANCTTSSTSSGEGAQTLSASCNDLAGNTGSASYDVKVDKTAPTISAAATTQPNGAGWYKGDVAVAFSCDDVLSGIANCPAPQILAGEGASISSSAQNVSDRAGNSDSSNVVTVAIDRTAPSVSVTGVSNGASYPIGSVPTAACSTTDALSGVASVATLSISGGNADGSGSFTATCAGASDKAGNSGAASVSYSVAYRWSGFFQPIDILPTINSVNAGKAVPVKFSLGGNYGLNIFAPGYPASQQVACSSSAPIDEIEQTSTAGNSSLSYDATSGQYSYTWKTEKSWAGQCRLLIVRLIDGTEHTASFKFK